jgi:hypothetical protein
MFLVFMFVFVSIANWTIKCKFISLRREHHIKDCRLMGSRAGYNEMTALCRSLGMQEHKYIYIKIYTGFWTDNRIKDCRLRGPGEGIIKARHFGEASECRDANI